jgi:hypothetical protein
VVVIFHNLNNWYIISNCTAMYNFYTCNSICVCGFHFVNLCVLSQGNVQNSGGALGLIYGRNSSVSCIHGVKSNGLIKTNLYTV